MEKLKPSNIDIEIVNWCSHTTTLTILQNVKDKLSSSSLRYIKRNEKICPQKNLYVNFCSNIFHNSQRQKQPNYLSTEK